MSDYPNDPYLDDPYLDDPYLDDPVLLIEQDSQVFGIPLKQNGPGGDVDLSDYAKLNSPALTGTPTAPTAERGTSNKQIATTEFVMNSKGNGLFPVEIVTPELGLDSYIATINLGSNVKRFNVNILNSTTIQLSNLSVPNGYELEFEIRLVYTYSKPTINWFSGITWIESTDDLEIYKTHCFVFRTADGINFIGNLAYSI